MSKKITCINANNVTTYFSYEEEAPFFLVSCDGIYSVSNNIQNSDNTNLDGSTYEGETVKERNIVITATMESDYMKKRDILYKVFKPKSTGIFIYEEDSVKKEIQYRTEDINVDESGVIRNISVSLICNDPYFKDPEYTVVLMAGVTANFEFPHQFTAAKEEFGVRTAEIIKPVINESSADKIGMIIEFEAIDAVLNPSLYCIETKETLLLETQMAAGDTIRIYTDDNNKNAYLIHGGVETNINNTITDDSTFLQLSEGTNTLRYDADAGRDYMNVNIRYLQRYLGV